MNEIGAQKETINCEKNYHWDEHVQTFGAEHTPELRQLDVQIAENSRDNMFVHDMEA